MKFVIARSKKGTKATEAIWVPNLEPLSFGKEAMRNMNRLRILYISVQNSWMHGSNCHDGSIEYLSNNLRWFVWECYPWESLPTNFEPKRLVHLDVRFSSLRFLWTGVKHLRYLRKLDLSYSRSLMRTPDFTGMPNLEYLDLRSCSNLEEVHHSLGYSRKLIHLNLNSCKSLKRFLRVNVESLECFYLFNCCSLSKLPEIIGRMKPELKIDMKYLGIRELPSSIILYQTHITELDLSSLRNLVALPSSIGKLKSLVVLDLWGCAKLEILPGEIGDLEKLEMLHARDTLISQPPSSIVRLNKLDMLCFAKEESEAGLEDEMHFVFPQVNEGLRSLVDLDLDYCNLIDGGLPDDIGCLSSLEVLSLRGNNFEHLPRSITQLGALRSLDLKNCKRLKELPDFIGLPNLKTFDLSNCMDLEDVHHSLGFLKKLCKLELTSCERHKRFPALCTDSLQYQSPRSYPSSEFFPEILSSICKLRSLVHLDVSYCSNLESFPETIGDLENLERLDASYTLISRPPSSIVRLNKLKFLYFAKQKSSGGLEDGLYFVFPPVNEGLRSLKDLDLSYCNLIDGALPQDIGCLSSLKELNLRGNNFEHLPQSIAQLGALRVLDLTECKNLTQLSELPPELDELHADFHLALKSIHNLVTMKKLQRVVLSPLYDRDEAYNDSIYNLFAHTLFQNLCSLQHDISASDSLSQRVITTVHPGKKIPSWFRYQGMDRNVSVKLPENWYVCDNFLGFVVCYYGRLIETTAQLIPFCDDGMSWMTTHKLISCNRREPQDEYAVHCFFVSLADLWDTVKANGKTPNDYGHVRLFFSGQMKKFGIRLLYKDENSTVSCVN